MDDINEEPMGERLTIKENGGIILKVDKSYEKEDNLRNQIIIFEDKSDLVSIVRGFLEGNNISYVVSRQ